VKRLRGESNTVRIFVKVPAEMLQDMRRLAPGGNVSFLVRDAIATYIERLETARG